MFGGGKCSTFVEDVSPCRAADYVNATSSHSLLYTASESTRPECRQ